MAFIIQTPPNGLLSALGMKSTGEQPRQLDEAVRAVFDASPFFLSSFITVASTSAAVQNVGDSVVTAPADGNSWWVLAVQGLVQVGAAGEQVKCSVMVRRTNTSRVRLFSGPIQTAVAANAQLSIAQTFPQGWLLPPGAGIELTIDDINVAAARTGNIAVVAYEIDV